jgi:hypothetical protein
VLKRIIVGAVAAGFAGTAAATPIPAATSGVAGQAGLGLVRVRLDRDHGRSGRVRRPYAIVVSIGLPAGLIAAAVIAD